MREVFGQGSEVSVRHFASVRKRTPRKFQMSKKCPNRTAKGIVFFAQTVKALIVMCNNGIRRESFCAES